AVEDHAERQEEQQGQISEGREAQHVAGPGGHDSASSSWRAPQRANHWMPPRMITEITKRTTDTAAAPVLSYCSICPLMYREETSVTLGRLPAIRTTDPNSPTARAKASATPESMAGMRLGRMILRKMVKLLAPKEAAASSTSRSSSSS